MLCVTTTRIILGFICFGPICSTGRLGHQQLLPTTPCFDQDLTRLQMNLDVHKTVHAYYVVLIIAGSAPFPSGVEKSCGAVSVQKAVPVAGMMCGIYGGPLLSSHHLGCHHPSLPSLEEQVKGRMEGSVFFFFFCQPHHTHHGPQGEIRLLSSGEGEAMRACVA